MSKEMRFVIFCIESYRAHRSMSGRDAAELFLKYDAFGYIRDNYDVLHTVGYQYINEDLDRYFEVRGAGEPCR